MKKRYVALIRGVNVGGHSIIKMADLRKVFESAGFTEVVTHIQSGNVIFSTHHSDREQLAEQIEQKLAPALGNRVEVFLRSRDELEEAFAHNPFKSEARDKVQSTYLMFLSAEPALANQKALMGMQGQEYQFHIHDSVLYYAYPRELAARRRTIDFERVLGVYGTSRSWKVVRELIKLTGGQGL
jgi:uncharacterized protein (DUF1697 family)